METIIAKGSVVFNSIRQSFDFSERIIKIKVVNYGNGEGQVSESYLHDLWKSSVKTGWTLKDEGNLICEGNGFVSLLETGFNANGKYCTLELSGKLLIHS